MGFKLQDRLRRWPWHQEHGGGQLHSRAFYGKVSAQSRAAKEHTHFAGPTWGVLLVLRRQEVTVFSHIIRKDTLPFFFFFFSCVIKHPHKRQMSSLGVLNPRVPFLIFWNKHGRVSPPNCAVTRRGTLDQRQDSTADDFRKVI